MNEPDREPLTEDQALAQQALATLAMPAADPEFRAALKRAFVAGDFSGVSRREAQTGSVLRLEPKPRPPIWRWAVLVPLSAAALLVIVSVLNRGPRWAVASTSGQGVAIVDGRPMPMNHIEDMTRLMTPGARVRIPDGCAIEIVCPGRMAFQFTSGTDATVPASPGRWFNRRIRADVSGGELRITTGADFRGAHLHITTPSAEVELTGTTAAVICEAEGTCVCVLEGKVQVAEKGVPPVLVEHGRRRYVFNDGRPPELAEIRAVEITELAKFRDEKRAVMK